MNDDVIYRQAALDCFSDWINKRGDVHTADEMPEYSAIEALPSAQPEDWMERNKERILQAGMEGREIEFRIGGRLFAIREKAQ